MHHYRLSGFGSMQLDTTRVEAYRAALRASIRPGAVVVDIGTGPGVMALWACEFGAGHVYAIEPNSAIEVARRVVDENDLGDRVTLIPEMSTRVDLPERADVVVSDLHGVLPLYEHHLPSIIDARSRLLRPGGTLVPRRDVVKAALANSTPRYQVYGAAWRVTEPAFTMHAAREVATSEWGGAGKVLAEELVVPAQVWATLDYATIDTVDASSMLTWSIDDATEVNGLVVWFDTELADGVGFSNKPGRADAVYGQAFFPLAAPIALEPDDVIDVTLDARLLPGRQYFWRWRTSVHRGESDERVVHFDQHTFGEGHSSLDDLRRQAESYRPQPNDDARVSAVFLSCLEASLSLGEIAERMHRDFPDVFPTRGEALDAARRLASTYGA